MLVSFDKERLPVKTTLLQNKTLLKRRDGQSDYQSKRRYSKTQPTTRVRTMPSDYQSKRRYSKTHLIRESCAAMSDYQSKRRYSKTKEDTMKRIIESDYQSKRRYSKTGASTRVKPTRAITSQNDATPKLTLAV